MALKAERTEYADRTHYLSDAEDVGIYRTTTEVVTWAESPSVTCSRVTLALHSGAFNFQTALEAQEARVIAQALLMAAEDAERAAAAVEAAGAEEVAA